MLVKNILRFFSKTDYYKDLGLNPGASIEEVKIAYRNKAMQYHPDRNPGK